MSADPSTSGRRSVASVEPVMPVRLELPLEEWSRRLVVENDPASLFRDWVRLAQQAGQAQSADVWLVSAGQRWTCLTESPSRSSAIPFDQLPEWHHRTLASVEPIREEVSDGSFRGIRLAARIMQGGQAVGLLHGVWRDDLYRRSERELVPFLAASGELAGDFLVQHELRFLRIQQASWRGWEDYQTKALQSSSLQQLAQTIAETGRSLTGTDRISVVKSGSSSRLIAVSGVEQIDSRSSTVRALERVAEACSSETGSPALLSEENFPTAVATSVEHLRETTGAEHVAIGLLRDRHGRVTGVIHFEAFSSTTDVESWKERCQRLRNWSEPCWQAQFEAERGLRSRILGSWPSRRRHRWAIGGVAVLVILALGCLPGELQVTAQGTLWPVQRRDVYSEITGIVSTVAVRHGDHVTAGQTLLELRDPTTDLNLVRVRGELQTARARLAVVQAARISGVGTGDPLVQSQQLASEESQLLQQLSTLEQQQRILELQRVAGTVVSPLDGEVLSWDLERRLVGRPIERGQALLTVGQMEGPWEVVAYVRERDAAELIAQNRGRAEPPSVVVLDPTSSTGTSQGRVQSIADVVGVDPRGEPAVQVVIAVDPTSGGALRPGTTVYPRISCGQRSLGYRVLRDMSNAMQRAWWLWWPWS